MGLVVFHGIFFNIFHIESEIGKCHGIFREILSIPQYIVMDLNNVSV